MGYIKGYNLLILAIDPNFQRDIQVYLALCSDSLGVMFFNPDSSSEMVGHWSIFLIHPVMGDSPSHDDASMERTVYLPPI